MRVVLATPGGMRFGGGIGTISRSIVEEMRTSHPDIDIRVVDTRGNGSAVASAGYALAAAIRIAGWRLKRAPMVLHLNVSERMSFLRKGVLLELARVLGVPTVLHHHGAEFIESFARAGRLRRFFHRRVIMSADVNIVLGELWRRHLIDCVGVPANRIVVLYNAIPDRFRDTVARAGIAKPRGGDVRLVMLANLMPRKGVSELLRAIRDLKAEGTDIGAEFVGGGDIGRYRKEAANLGLENECRFTGWLSPDESFERLCAADIFVLPSFNEGLPMAILEALCAGIPVVATPVGAIPEVLHGGKDCLLVPPGDPEALKNAISELRRNPELARSISAAGRKLFAESFTIRRYVQTLRTIYEQVLKAGLERSAVRAERRGEPRSA